MGEKGTSVEEMVWPEPPKRVVPPVRSTLWLPDDVACPQRCEVLKSSALDPVTVSKLK